DGGGAGGAGPGNGQFDPVADGGVLGLTAAPDVAGGNVMLQEHGAGAIDDAHPALGGDFKGLVVRPVFFGLLSHQADVGDGAHGGRIKGTVLLAVLDHR